MSTAKTEVQTAWEQFQTDMRSLRDELRSHYESASTENADLQTSLNKLGKAADEVFDVAGYEVQPIVAKGVEMIVGVVQDQHFGPVVACGAGGIATELVKDVTVRITPITRGEAGRMIRSLKTFPLLDGYRGAPRADISALEDVILRVNALVEAHPEVAEMDLNPVIVHTDGAVVVDARIRLEPGSPKAPIGAR